MKSIVFSFSFFLLLLTSCGDKKPAPPAVRDSVFILWEPEKPDPCKDLKPPSTDCGYGYMLLRKNGEALCTFICMGSDTEYVNIGRSSGFNETMMIHFDRELEYDVNDLPGKKMRGAKPKLCEWKESGCRPSHYLFTVDKIPYRAIKANKDQEKYFLNELRMLKLIR